MCQMQATRTNPPQTSSDAPRDRPPIQAPGAEQRREQEQVQRQEVPLQGPMERVARQVPGEPPFGPLIGQLGVAVEDPEEVRPGQADQRRVRVERPVRLPVVQPVHAGPADRAGLHGKGAEQGQETLDRPGGLEAPVGEHPVESHVDAELARQQQERDAREHAAGANDQRRGQGDQVDQGDTNDPAPLQVAGNGMRGEQAQGGPHSGRGLPWVSGAKGRVIKPMTKTEHIATPA
jgi:hypothetical protein